MVIDPKENVLQHELDRFQEETTQNNFLTNKNKTFIMVFNATRKYAFPPDFKLGDSLTLELKESHQILGVQVQTDFKWADQITHMTKNYLAAKKNETTGH